MWAFFERGKNGRKQPYIMYFARAHVRAHTCTRADTYYACKCKKIHAKPVQKTAKTRKNLLRNYFDEGYKPKKHPKTQKMESPVHHKNHDFCKQHDK